MQTDKLYPTQSTTTDGIQLTDHLQDISGFADTMADAYLMGYIQADKMPAAFMPVYLSGGVGEMSAIYRPKNTGWGYSILYHSANNSNKAATITRVNNDIVFQPAGMDVYSFINSAEMARANTGLDISLTVTFAYISDAVYDGDGGTTGFVYGGTEAGSWGSGSTRTYSYTFDQFANIIANDLPLFSVTRTGNAGAAAGKSFLFEPRPSDFGDSNDPLSDHKYCVDTGLGLHAVLLIRGYTINAQMQYGSGAGMAEYYLRPFTYPDIDAVGNFDSTKSIIIPSNQSEAGKELTWSYNVPTDTFTLQPGSTSSNSIANYNIFPGGFNFGTLQSAGIDFTVVDQNYDLIAKKSIWMGASHYGETVSGNIVAHYTPMDVYLHALLYHKHTTDGTLTTYSTDTWVTKFNTKNVPSDTIVSGELSDIKLDLQPWQYPEIDITVNTFTSKDIPDSSDTGINLIRFGDITPSEFQFKDISIEKIYFGSSLLYQKSVPEQYVKLNPTDKFISEKTSVDDYRIYGELPAGDIILSVRTPRTKNLLPYPYSGIETGPGGDIWEPRTDYNYPDHSSLAITDHGDGTFEWVNQATANYKSSIAFENQRVLYPAGTYTMSHAPGTTFIPQLDIWTYDENGTQIGSYTDNNPGQYGTGRITFSASVPFYLRTSLYVANAYSYSSGYSRPQLEAGSTITEYEPPNEPTLTTITLPRALEENEYISYADQKIMPTGTPLVVPKLKTKVGENVIMIENYPRATNTITLTPATKE